MKLRKRLFSETHSEKTLKASYLISYELALAGKPHTLAETFIKPLLVKVVKCMEDEKTANLVSSIHLSNNTVRNRIQDLPHDVKDTIIFRISQKKFSLQLDEFTDVAGLAVLMAFVRYEFLGIFHEDILLCRPLPFSTSGSEIFSMLGAFFIENGTIALTCAQMAQKPWWVILLALFQGSRKFRLTARVVIVYYINIPSQRKKFQSY